MPQKQLLQAAGDGSAVQAGYVGEVIFAFPASNITPGVAGATVTICSINLTPGVWQIHGKASWANGATAPTGFLAIFGGIGIGTPSSWNSRYNFSSYPVQFAGAQTVGVAGLAIANISSNTTVYLNGAANYTALNGAVWSTDSIITAVRIA